jgi:hypothetical protein
MPAKNIETRREISRRHYANNKERVKERISRRKKANRAAIINLLGNECSICGAKENLKLHSKTFSRKRSATRICDRGIENREDLLDQVIVLCKLCSEEYRHKKLIKNNHGTSKMYAKGCRCLPCSAAEKKKGLLYKNKKRRQQKPRPLLPANLPTRDRTITHCVK